MPIEINFFKLCFCLFFFFSCSNSNHPDTPVQLKNNSNVNRLVDIIDKEEKTWLAKELKKTVETQLYWGKNKYLDTAFTFTYHDDLKEERYKVIFLSDEPNMNITFIANDSLNKSIMIKPGNDSSQVNYLHNGKIIHSKNISILNNVSLTFLSKEEEALFKRTINSN
ncbi:MAG: hypothetical protein H0V91_04105 [Flavisolibacter sp.]|nr:hypothetical protein [Flavisolibacter sp.]